jgi:hypothetical protein
MSRSTYLTRVAVFLSYYFEFFKILLHNRLDTDSDFSEEVSKTDKWIVRFSLSLSLSRHFLWHEQSHFTSLKGLIGPDKEM